MSYHQKFWTLWLTWGLIVLCLPITWFSFTILVWKNRPWTDYLWLLGAAVFLVIVRFIQRKGIEDRVNNQGTNPLYHLDDVWFEGTERPVMKDTYLPVKPIEKWYQARYQKSPEVSSQMVRDDHDSAIHNAYEAYLQTFKH